MKAAGFEVTHLYGLTETYGPAAVNEWQGEWDALDESGQAGMKARQGVRYQVLDALDVLDLDKRAVFVMHEIDGTPIPAVATALGIPVNTAYSRLRLAREAFTAQVKRLRLRASTNRRAP